MPNGNELAKAIYENALERFVGQKAQPGDEQLIVMGAMYQKIETLANHLCPSGNEHKGLADHAREKGPWVAGGGGLIAFITWLLEMLTRGGG